MWLLPAGLWAAGCAESPTQLLVVVDSDLSVPSELTSVEVRATVSGRSGEVSTIDVTGAPGTSCTASSCRLPLSVGVSSSSVDANESVEILVRGLGPAGEVVARRVRTGFVMGKRLLVPVFLSSRCRGVSCMSGATCERGACVTEAVDPSTLQAVPPDFDPEDTFPKGGADAATQVADAGSPRDADEPRADASPPDEDAGVFMDASAPLDTGAAMDAEAPPDLGVTMDASVPRDTGVIMDAMAPPNLADIVVQSVTCTPDPITAGDTISCDIELRNQGTAATGTFDNRLYMSMNANITTQDVLLNTCASPSIAAGASNTVACTGVVPVSTTGARYFGVLADSGDDVMESDEANNDNDISDTVTVTAPPVMCMDDSRSNATSAAADSVSSGTSLANLQVCPNASDWFRIDLNMGDTIRVVLGFVHADGNINVRLYGNNTSSNVLVGQSTTNGEDVTYVAQATERHYIRVYGAPSPTSHSVDNTYSLQVTVTPGVTPMPDLEVDNINCTPEPVVAGTTISCSVRIANRGTAASGSFTNQLRMSGNTMITTGDTLIDTCSSSAIAAGATRTITCSGTVPTSASGNQYFGMLVDSGGAVTESNESNNDDDYDAVQVNAACTESAYWNQVSGGTVTVVDSAGGQNSLDIEFRTSSRTSPTGQARFRVCKPSGETFSNDIHVRFRNGLTPNTNLMLFDGMLTASGNQCSNYGYFDPTELQRFDEGERIGGNIRIVSPNSCNTNWGSSSMFCTSPPNPGCGTCFGRVTGAMLVRTCR